ncbi:MAG TPA: FemAB family protein [Pseudolabrys sp.]|nr:FemAB family protein [Pseudolabrys sp.]
MNTQLQAADTEGLTLFLHRILDEVGLRAQLGAVAARKWREVCEQLPYLPVSYAAAMVEYQLAYWSDKFSKIFDISLILEHDNRPCGLLPLSLVFDFENGWRLSSNGGPVVRPLFISGIPKKAIKVLAKRCLEFLEKVCEGIGQKELEIVEVFSGGYGFGGWYNALLSSGPRVELFHELFLDLSPDIADIKNNFRKSYKPLISKGLKLWSTEVICSACPQQWEEFRQFHRVVAGKSTRSEDSWQKQHDAIAAGDAFFVCLRDAGSRMIGGGLFHLSPHEGMYAVGVYDRALFDKPLGHVVQYCAIEEMKRRGVRWYKIGVFSYPGGNPPPTGKELSISMFEQGFSSHTFPRVKITKRIDRG